MRERLRKRPGSRLLLGVALLSGTFASMFAGARLADFLTDLLDVTWPPLRIGVKALLVAAALPAGYYLVERFFIERSARKIPGPRDPDRP